LPREGYLNAFERVLDYFKKHSKGRITIDTTYSNHFFIPLKIIPTRSTSIQILQKKYPSDIIKSPRPKVQMTIYMDEDHVHDLVIRSSIIGIIFMLNNTPIRWISKRQKTVENST
jgi:hypothetical protein